MQSMVRRGFSWFTSAVKAFSTNGDGVFFRRMTLLFTIYTMQPFDSLSGFRTRLSLMM